MRNFLKILVPFMYHERKVLFLNKVSNVFYKKGHVRLALIVEGLLLRAFNCHISCQCLLPNTTKLPHPVGIVIGSGCIVEENVTIYQGVTLGRSSIHKAEYPKVCSDVIIYANAVLVGNITINKGCIVGALAFLNRSTNNDTKYLGVSR